VKGGRRRRWKRAKGGRKELYSYRAPSFAEPRLMYARKELAAESGAHGFREALQAAPPQSAKTKVLQRRQTTHRSVSRRDVLTSCLEAIATIHDKIRGVEEVEEKTSTLCGAAMAEPPERVAAPCITTTLELRRGDADTRGSVSPGSSHSAK
jgi:hypothetical protein